MLRQLHIYIGIKQIKLERHFHAAQLLHFLILREQTQRGVIRTMGQRIEIVGDAEQGMTQHIAMHVGNLFRVRCKLAQGKLQFGTKYCRTFQAHHLEHTQQTVQLGTHCLQSRTLIRGSAEIQFQLRINLGQRAVHARLHRGKRVAIKLCAIGHVRLAILQLKSTTI